MDTIKKFGQPSTTNLLSSKRGDKAVSLHPVGGGVVAPISFELTPCVNELPFKLVNSSISHTDSSRCRNGADSYRVSLRDLSPRQRDIVRQDEEDCGYGVGFVVNRLRSGETTGACYSLGKRNMPPRVKRVVSQEFSNSARKKIRRVFDCNPDTFKTFFSVTFDARLPQVKLDAAGNVCHVWAKEQWERFLRALYQKYYRLAEKTNNPSKKLSYLWVAELQHESTNNIHFHLVTNKQFIDANWLRSLWGLGSVNVKKIGDSRGAGSYLRKYIQKGSCTIQGNRYNMSADLHDAVKPLRINLYGRKLRNHVPCTLR